MTTEQLRAQAARQYHAARSDLSKPGRTPAVTAYYRTLQRLQARLRKQAAQGEAS